MKNSFFYSLIIIVLSIFIASCSGQNSAKIEEQDTSRVTYTYSMSIELTSNKKAPELQSFGQARYGNEWFLFAGRFNPAGTKNGGLHGIHSKSGSGLNYANHGFPPPSFNETLFVYDVSQDSVVAQMDYNQFEQTLIRWSQSASLSTEAKNVCSDLVSKKALLYQTFRGTNPQVIQDGDYVYAVGGYGTPQNMPIDTNVAYQTFSSVAKIHVPSMISALKNDSHKVDWSKFLQVGAHPRLQATGGELLKIGDVLYLCGGHNFAYNALPGLGHNQKYSDALYPFTLKLDTNLGFASVKVTILDTITDINPKSGVLKYSADTISYFRRRDGPIVPVLFKNSNGLSQGIAYYGGVFKPVKNAEGKMSSPPLAAWNDAIYIFDSSSVTGALNQHKRDTAYNQKNFNVYSCPDFGVYDSVSEKMFTFLPGGIGNGLSDGNLSAFTNTAVQAVLDVKNKTTNPNFIKTEKVFGSDTNYYGAESVFVPASNNAVQYIQVGNDTSQIISANNSIWKGNKVEIGYIYGGIEANIASPGKLVETKSDTIARPGYGKGYSGATGKIWKVTLIRIEDK